MTVVTRAKHSVRDGLRDAALLCGVIHGADHMPARSLLPPAAT